MTDAQIADMIARWRERNGHEATCVRAALIDMDGTLYNSMPRHSQAWERLATEEGLEFAPGEFYLHEGRTGAATIDLLFRRSHGRDATAEERAELYERKTRYFIELPDVEAMPGAERMLNTFIQAGITRVLVTGSGQNSLIDRLAVDYPGAFSREMMVTSRSVTRGKPHPEPFLRGMELAGVTAAQAVVIENAPLGVEAGHASGALTLAANTGPIDPQELVRAGADAVFASMEALADALPAILRRLA